MNRLKLHRLMTSLAALSLASTLPWTAGCKTRLWELENGAIGPDAGAVVLDLAGPTRLPVDLSPRSKIDLLVMVDNSFSMDEMQLELQRRFPDFLAPFNKLVGDGVYADLHLGVVTSDYGEGATGAGNCEPSPGGQRGMLQAIGDAARPGCKPPVADNFIRYSFAPGGANNLPPGRSLADTFTCMASVGSQGCGYEHQLESVHAALGGGVVQNKGFLRDDAVLGVLFVTNEDDASAPADTDLFDDGKSAQYGYPSSYSRQTRFAIQCGQPPAFPPYGDTNGPLTDCAPAPNWPTGTGPGKQFDVRRYIDFFTLPKSQGGIKDDPDSVLLFAIDAPETPFEVILSNERPSVLHSYPLCPKLDEMAMPPCIPVLQHSCVSARNSAFFGDPSVRLNTVVRAVASHDIANICDADFTGALSKISSVLAGRLGQGCVPFALPKINGNIAADCDVYDAVIGNAGTGTVIPACGKGTLPCWRIQPKAACGQASPQGVGITIDRDQPAPRGTEPRAICTAGP